MKTYDTIQMLRRLAFGATLLTATALLPACDDDPAAPDEELTTDPGTSVQPETLRFISYNILEGMKLDKAQNFDNFVDWVKEKDPDFMALCECNAFTEESLTALAGRYGHPYAILCKESGFPVGLTSKYPIELRNRLLEDVPLWHGASLSAINAENQQIIKQTPNFTPKNIKLGVFILFKTNHIRSENNLIKNRTNEKNNQFIFRKISYLCSK